MTFKLTEKNINRFLAKKSNKSFIDQWIDSKYATLNLQIEPRVRMIVHTPKSDTPEILQIKNNGKIVFTCRYNHDIGRVDWESASTAVINQRKPKIATADRITNALEYFIDNADELIEKSRKADDRGYDGIRYHVNGCALHVSDYSSEDNDVTVKVKFSGKYYFAGYYYIDDENLEDDPFLLTKLNDIDIWAAYR